MMKSLIFVPTLATLISAAAVVGPKQKVTYDGDKVFRIATGDDVAPLQNIIDSMALPTWKGVTAGVPKANWHVDLVVPKDKLEDFNTMSAGMNISVMHDDLGASIAAEADFDPYAGSPTISWFNSYHSYADHLTFLSDLVAAYPNNSEIIKTGESGEGRQITGIHFYGTSGGGTKPAIVLHSTVHAREWIATMVNEYIAWNLLSNYTTDTTIKGFIDDFDFYVIPVVNPDGFVYTQTTERLWRKNRQAGPSSSSCIGTDINRNWPYKWAVTGGASTDPCAEDYKGTAAASATENPVLSSYVDKLAAAQTVRAYVDMHSYSQLFMTPYGYSCSATASNNAKEQSLAKGVASAIEAVYGTSYQYGPICTTIYEATGNSVDYVKDKSGVTYPFTIELRDTGTNGFVLPKNQILPSGVETYAGFAYLFANI